MCHSERSEESNCTQILRCAQNDTPEVSTHWHIYETICIEYSKPRPPRDIFLAMPFFPLLQAFATSLTQNFSSLTRAQPEDQLKPAVKNLLESAGTLFDQSVLLRSEAQVVGLGGRPDFGADSNGLLCGHIELKAPGWGARPNSFTGRDKEQWQKFKSLPNLIYTDGNEWSLWRSGTSVGSAVRLAGDVRVDGASAATQENAQSLENLLRDFLMWQPVVPSQPRELAQMLAPLCRLVREDVAASVANEHSALFSLAREWRDLLFPNATNSEFADAYAQTLTYALLLARVEGGEKLTIDSAADTIQARHGLLSQALRVLAQAGAREGIGQENCDFEFSIFIRASYSQHQRSADGLCEALERRP